MIKSTLFETKDLDIDGNKWKSSVKVNPMESDSTAMDLFVQFLLDKGEDKSSGVAIGNKRFHKAHKTSALGGEVQILPPRHNRTSFNFRRESFLFSLNLFDDIGGGDEGIIFDA